MASLATYQRKRRLGRTPEPAAKRRASKTGDLFVVQKHIASRLHYDFRLEVDGVLKSWAVPKGPSLDPNERRMAVEVEDHPVDYADFEGIIPEGEYGAGTVMVWDRGTYRVEGDVDVGAALRRGRLRFILNGNKLKGAWALVRMRDKHWLLIKQRDRHASTDDVERRAPTSVVSGRLLRQIAADEGGDIAKAATADPPKRGRGGAAHP
jgi:bifunctional non-homologous end joining protein LigD